MQVNSSFLANKATIFSGGIHKVYSQYIWNVLHLLWTLASTLFMI